MGDTFKVKIVGVLFKPDRKEILVGKTFDDKVYTFLEGDLSYDEELDICLKRVAFEKTGYKIHNLGAIYAENKLKEKNELKLYFLCEATEGKEMKGKNVDKLKWIKPHEAEKYLETKFPSRLHEYILSLE